MVKRIIAVIVLVPVAVIVVAFSVANRHPVGLTLDPFHPGNPALSYSAPFFAWLFIAFALGLIVGGLATWFGQGKHRKLSRQRGQEADRLRRDAGSTGKPQPAAGGGAALPAPQ